jgi:hypothetical protein
MKTKLLLFSTFLAAFFGLQQNASAQYCTPAYTISCGTYNMTVNSFSTTGGSVNITNNNQGCSNSTGYTYYSSLGHTTLTNSTVNFSVGTGTTYATHVYIWVDWNQDDDFYDAGEQVAFVLSQAANSTWSGSFDVPATATSGTTRMRIRTLYYGSSGMHPCNQLPYGEAEDYNLTILPPFNNDAGIGEILNPVIPTCNLDSVNIDVSVQNLGSDTLQNCSIYYQVNTSTPVAMYYTGSVAPSGGLDTLTLGNVSFSNGDDLTVWTELPNGVPDSLNANDEQSMVTATGLTGTFGIPGDYATINDAKTDLESFGVCGDVIFNLAAGTYNEQVSFGDILGTSEDATVTFQSASGTWNSASIEFANNYTIDFNGGDWITFKNLKVKNTSGNVFKMTGTSDHITVDGCWAQGANGTSTTSQSLFYMQGVGHDLTLINNRLERGATWFYSTSGSTTSKKTNLTIEDNDMKNQTYYGAYIYYFNGVEVNRNEVRNDSAFQYGYGYYALGYYYYCDNFNITKNYVGAEAQNGYYYAMYLYQCVGTSNPRSQISNNCITTGNATSPTAYYALYMSQSGLVDIYNNSFTRMGNNSSYGIYIYQGGAMNLVNNSIANMGPGYGMYVNGAFAINTSDYNNIYNTSGQLTYFGSSVYNTLEDHQNGTGQDMHSVVSDPNWEDWLTCNTCNDTLGNAGTFISNVTDDISGNVRSVQSPDIGAIEYVTPATFTLGGDDTICGNEAIVEAGPAQSVTWNVNNQTSTQSFVTLTATTEPVTYNVSVNITTEFCGSGSDAAVIRLVPNASLDSSDHICADETLDLEPGGSSAADYAWSTGATTATITVDEPGTYSVTKMEDGCESSASIAISQSIGVELADVEGCEDDAPLTVDATIPDGSSYAWSGGSAQTSAANEFSTSGAYTITATDIHGCVSTAGFDLLVLGEPVAAIDYVGTGGTAVVFSSGSSTNTSPNTTYLWTFNSIDTSTAANPTYVFPWSAEEMIYPVTLVVDNGCGENLKSKDVKIAVLGVDELDSKEFEVYPNPATDNFFIAAGSDFNTLDVTIYDNAGRSVYSQSFNGQQTIEVNASELASGAYLIKMVSETSSEVQTLIVQ